MADQHVIFLHGPTATGKSSLALELASRFPIDLISVDSGQVYRGMEIGTARLSEDLLAQFPHHLIGIRDVPEIFSVGDFCTQARFHIDEILKRERIPLLVGGTMFYFSALLRGIPKLPAADQELRQRLGSDVRQNGLGATYRRLQKMDPVSANRIDSNDRQRILRALEINILTGKRVSECASSDGLDKTGVKVSRVSLSLSDRRTLHRCIDDRLREMIDSGLVDEVRGIRSRYPQCRKTPAMKSVGYQQVWSYLENEVDERQMIADIATATRRLAKRQLTWLRHERGLTWFDASSGGLVSSVSRYLDAANISMIGRQA
ncbi:MAG: tRNA (adenosine(37)-N6)-dimethylallyltransferase MiaA [Proteobacteria bacterium]|nr:tRNA (adenosine(37)-N6)-dimethylallyltransferase MiaA [Pseudomonadota bacterium]MBT4987374.1 tRNA (adenosine(37)-N6)-dimethylallyltransferase MiaA [Pseudomonadota bacterium]MBT5626220.1 tRNA (adenosine(37)-N6)-dimethylallyltransferase MiaA [Pseudomonadota bacterium]MBT6657110.1 tRNA (adenosine(37)-N6)-dimethylallyltransferase MiaA [Pseudomonadota bacterium]MBT7671083.1 tRNA (adenosine(37)-N6)-dimethylallyltransferase MiaA [Pseudomonadota bacterium]